MSAVWESYVEKLFLEFADLVRDGEISDAALIDEVLSRFGRSRDDLREAAGGTLPGDEPDTQPRQAEAAGQASEICRRLSQAGAWVNFTQCVQSGLIREPSLIAKSVHAYGCSVDDLLAAVPSAIRWHDSIEAELAKLTTTAEVAAPRNDEQGILQELAASIVKPTTQHAQLIFTPPELPDAPEQN